MTNSRGDTDEEHPGDNPSSRDPSGEQPIERVAASTLRVILLIVGLLLVLYASGQAMGIDVLAMVSDTLDAPEVRWLVVAFFGLIMIALALQGFSNR